MPHPLPEKPYPPGFDYYIVALPEGVGFRRVAQAIFTELSYPWLWGLEGLEDDSEDAAQRWTDAVNETWRLLEMGWPDDVYAAIDDVETLLRAIRDSGVGTCCDTLPGSDALVGQPGTKDTSDTDVSGSTFPDGLTEPQFDDYLCDAANAYVDSLIELPNTLLDFFQGTYASLIIAILYFTGGAFLAVAGLAVFTLAELLGLVDNVQSLVDAVTGGTEDTQSTVSAELQAARSDLVCAIYTANDHEEAGTQLRQAISDAVDSTAWTNVLLLLNPDSLLAKVFNHELKPETTGLSCATCGLSSGYNLIDAEITADVEDAAGGGSYTVNDNVLTIIHGGGGPTVKPAVRLNPAPQYTVGLAVTFTDEGAGTKVRFGLSSTQDPDMLSTLSGNFYPPGWWYFGSDTAARDWADTQIAYTRKGDMAVVSFDNWLLIGPDYAGSGEAQTFTFQWILDVP